MKIKNWFEEKIRRLTFWDMCAIKITLIIFGIIIGAYISTFVKQYVWYFVIVFIVLYAVVVYRFFKKW